MKILAFRAPTPVPRTVGGSHTATTRLSDDLIAEQVKRLEVVSTVAAGLWAFGLLMDQVLVPLFVGPRAPLAHGVIALLAIVSSVAMLLYVKYVDHRPATKMDVGLGFMLPSTILQKLGRRLHHAQRLGSYQLVERLGHGGMGEVWRATHQLIARDAAVKLVRADVLGGSEARATAALSSPHTIEIFDFGLGEDGARTSTSAAHGAGDHPGRKRRGPPRRCIRAGVCGVLSPDGPAGIRGRYADEDAPAARLSCATWNHDTARTWWEAHLPELTGPLTLDDPAEPGLHTEEPERVAPSRN